MPMLRQVNALRVKLNSKVDPACSDWQAKDVHVFGYYRRFPSALPGELRAKLLRTINYAGCRTTRLSSNRTSTETEWISARDLPPRNCQGSCQPRHGILAEQCDCYAAYRQAG